MSYHIVPPSSRSADGPYSVDHQSTAHPVSGTFDSMRHGLVDKGKHSVDGGSVHALQNRLEQWEATQRTLRLTLQRNTFGLGLPLRTMMDRKLVSQGDNGFSALDEPMSLGGSKNLALEILDGKDEKLDVADFMGGGQPPSEVIDVHARIAKHQGMA